MDRHSELFTQTMGMLYPVIILFGIYITANGHVTPGGGFQGGAILAAAFIVHYLSNFSMNVNLSLLNLVEKVLYLSLLTLTILVVFYLNPSIPQMYKVYYLIAMNFIISIKVCCGLTIIFFRFVLFESR